MPDQMRTCTMSLLNERVRKSFCLYKLSTKRKRAQEIKRGETGVYHCRSTCYNAELQGVIFTRLILESACYIYGRGKEEDSWNCGRGVDIIFVQGPAREVEYFTMNDELEPLATGLLLVSHTEVKDDQSYAVVSSRSYDEY